MSIAVLLLVRNNETYLQHLFTLLNDSTYTFFIYENNSTDNTVLLCNEFLKSHTGKIFSENIDESNKDFLGEGTQFERIERIANVRNKLLTYVRDDIINFDWCLFIDTDIYFDLDIVTKMLEYYHEKTVMITCNTLEVLEKNKNDNVPDDVKFITERHYYDTFAYVNNNNKMCYPYCTNQDCLYKYCKPRTITVSDSIEKVRAAWGGIVLVKGSVFKNLYVQWKPLLFKDNNSLCEHLYFCDMIGTIGNIIKLNNIYAYRKHISTKSFNLIWVDTLENDLISSNLKCSYILKTGFVNSLTDFIEDISSEAVLGGLTDSWFFISNLHNKDSVWIELVNTVFGFKVANHSTRIIHQNALNVIQNKTPFCYLNLNQGFFIHSTIIKHFKDSDIFKNDVKNINIIEKLFMFATLNAIEIKNTEIPFVYNIINEIEPYRASDVRDYVNSFISSLFLLKDESWKEWNILKMTAISHYSRRNIILQFDSYSLEDLGLAHLYFKKTAINEILLEELYTISNYYYYFIFDDLINIPQEISDIFEEFGKTRHVYVAKKNEIKSLDTKFEIDMIGLKYDKFIITKM